MAMSKSQIESKWGVKVVLDFKKGNSNYYKIYTADGCPWENGLRSMIGVEAECRRYSSHILHIKESVEKGGVDA